MYVGEFEGLVFAGEFRVDEVDESVRVFQDVVVVVVCFVYDLFTRWSLSHRFFTTQSGGCDVEAED